MGEIAGVFFIDEYKWKKVGLIYNFIYLVKIPNVINLHYLLHNELISIITLPFVVIRVRRSRGTDRTRSYQRVSND